MGIPALEEREISQITSGTGFTVSIAALTVNDDDTLVFMVSQRSSTAWAAVDSALTSGDGEQVADFVRTSIGRMSIYVLKVPDAGSLPSSYSFTGVSNIEKIAYAMRISGADTTDPTDANTPTTGDVGGPSTTATSTGFTTAGTDRLVINFTACDFGADATAMDNSFTYSTGDNVVQANWKTAYGEKDYASAGATGNVATTLDASRFWLTIQLGIVGAAAAAVGHPIFNRKAFQRAALVR